MCGLLLLRWRVMDTDPPGHPRVSPTVKRWLNWVLTGVWLVGGALIPEALHISLWAKIALIAVLLGVVLGVELVFYRWNEGRWPAVAAAGNRDESNAGTRRRCGLTLASASAHSAGFCALGAAGRCSPHGVGPGTAGAEVAALLGSVSAAIVRMIAAGRWPCSRFVGWPGPT